MNKEFGQISELPPFAETLDDLLAFEALKWVGHPSVKYLKDRPIDPNFGFDCSGFIVWCFHQISIPIPQDLRYASQFLDNFGILVHHKFQKRGDLVIFSTKDGTRPKHVGIMMDQNRYIHAPGMDGTTIAIRNIEHQEIQTRTNHDQIYGQNPIAFKRPTLSYLRWQTEYLDLLDLFPPNPHLFSQLVS